MAFAWLDTMPGTTYAIGALAVVVVILWVRVLSLEHDAARLSEWLFNEREERQADRLYLEDSIDLVAAGTRGAKVTYRRDQS